MAPKYTVFRKPDGTHSATTDESFLKFYPECTAIYTGVAGNQTRKLMRELNKQKPATAPDQPKTQEWRSVDVDSGLGIGGINNDQSMPTIPSVRAIERVQKMHDTDTICRKCGASENFDGAMFTTLGGSNICDDCA